MKCVADVDTSYADVLSFILTENSLDFRRCLGEIGTNSSVSLPYVGRYSLPFLTISPAVTQHPDCDWLSESSLQKFDQLDINAQNRNHPFIIVLSFTILNTILYFNVK